MDRNETETKSKLKNPLEQFACTIFQRLIAPNPIKLEHEIATSSGQGSAQDKSEIGRNAVKRKCKIALKSLGEPRIKLKSLELSSSPLRIVISLSERLKLESSIKELSQKLQLRGH